MKNHSAHNTIWFPQFNRKMMFGICVLILMLSAIVVWYNIFSINRDVHQRIERALQLARQVLPPAIWQFNYDYLDYFSQSLLIDDRLISVCIKADQDILIEQWKPEFNRCREGDFRDSQKFSVGITDITLNERVIGQVKIVFSRKGLYLGTILNTTLTILGLCGILVIMLIYYMKLQESERNYRTLFDNAIEGVFQSTPEGRFLNVNASMARILGYASPQELMLTVTDIGRQVYIRPDIRRQVLEIIEREGNVSEFETQFITKQRELIWVSIFASARRGIKKEVVCYDGLLLEITERKQKEKAEREQKAAEASDKAKSEFLANMSHEIRTPMNAIIGIASLMQKSPLTDQQTHYLNIINDSASTLLSIINDILDLSKIEARKLELEFVRFNLRELFDELNAMFMSLAEEKHIDLLISIDPHAPENLVGDPLRLRQILINLIANAIKFTHVGHVLIGVARIEPQTDNYASAEQVKLRFSVKDSGIGIEREKVARLFDSFTQADSSITRKYGGTGLGLTISKQLANMMGGDIKLQTAPGKGSEFSFEIFLFTEPDAEQSALWPPNLPAIKALALDTTPDSQAMLLNLLNYLSISTLSAGSAEEAWDKLLTADPPCDLILIDQTVLAQRPGQLITKIRQQPELAPVPIILITDADADCATPAPEQPLAATLIKPVSKASLLEAIYQALHLQPSDAAPAPEPQPHDNAPFVSFAGKNKVLLVEDNIINQEVAVELLKLMGLIVDVAVNGQEALDALRTTAYHLILMDVQMPVMDGYEATRRIRQGASAKIPIIAMTAHAASGDREKCLAVGMDDYVSKPIDFEQLYKMLSQWLKPGLPQHSCGPPLPEAAEHPASTATYINLEALEKRVRGNRPLAFKLLYDFKRRYADLAATLQTCRDRQDFNAAKQLTHEAKGVAGNISAEKLYQALADIESRCNRQGAEPDAQEWEHVNQVIKETFEFLDSLLITANESETAASPAPPMNQNITAELGILLKQLGELLNTNSILSEAFFNTIKPLIIQSGFAAEAEALDNLIQSFDFKSARIELTGLISKIAGITG